MDVDHDVCFDVGVDAFLLMLMVAFMLVLELLLLFDAVVDVFV